MNISLQQQTVSLPEHNADSSMDSPANKPNLNFSASMNRWGMPNNPSGFDKPSKQPDLSKVFISGNKPFVGDTYIVPLIELKGKKFAMMPNINFFP